MSFSAANARPLPFGKYLLLDRISIGGMAEIWRARAEGAGGLIAIKRILPSVAEDPDCVAMFMDEARITLQLRHPNIAQVFELGQVGSSYFIAMEYVRGKDLRQLFERSREVARPIPIPVICYVISRVCDALDYAHRKKDPHGREMRIVHRDVSPQNVLVGYQGEVKVIDFGIAKMTTALSQSQAGTLKGKTGYMSPERVRGLPVDRRSDVFGIGICLYELLTGERLFADDAEVPVLERIRAAQIKAPSGTRSELAPELDRIALKSLARDPENRYQYASELARDLDRFLIESRSFFERKDLMGHMAATFGEDFLRESVPETAQGTHPGASFVALLPKIEAAGPMLSNQLATDPGPRSESSGLSSDRRPSKRVFGGVLAPDGRLAASEAASRSRLHPALFAALGGAAALAAVGLWVAIGEATSMGILKIDLSEEAMGKPAQVTVNGEPWMEPPPELEKRMKAGTVSIAVVVDGYEPFAQNVQVKPGRAATRVHAALRPRVQTAELAVVSDPERAEIRMDGRVLKPAGSPGFFVGSIPVGSDHLIEVRYPGYKGWDRKIAASAADERLQLRASLEPREFLVRFASQPTGAILTANGRRLGRTPAEIPILANIGKVTLNKRCYEPVEVAVSSPAEPRREPMEPVLVDVSLKRLPGCR